MALRAAALLLLLAAPGRAAEDLSGRFRDHNVVILSLTAVGASRFGVYGAPARATPGLDRWSRDALVFDTVYTHASWTLPAAASMFTGLYPYTHGVWKRVFQNRLHPRDRTLAETLAARGYLTAAFTGGLDHHPRFSHLRGFRFKPENPHYTTLRVTAAQALDWLSAYGRERRFLLFVQGYDAHCPFRAEAPFRGRYADPADKSPALDPTRCVRGFSLGAQTGPSGDGAFRAYYAGHCPRLLDPSAHETCRQGDPVTLTRGDMRYIEASYEETVSQADAHASRFLASLPPETSSRTIVVVVSEHGELFAGHGRFGRSGTRRGAHYDEVLRVPLMVRLPGVPGRRVEGLAELVDLAPTLLDLLGLEAPEGVQGLSLAPLAGGAGPARDLSFSGVPYNIRAAPSAADRLLFDRVSLSETARDARWKLLHETVSGRDQWAKDADEEGEAGEPHESWKLYDTLADPRETTDLAASRPEEAARLRARLEAWRRETFSRRRPGAGADARIPEDLLKEARERGYWQ